MPRHKHNALTMILTPTRPIIRMTAEIWEDYKVFKAAGLLKEWLKKWAAYLPAQ